MRKQLLYIAAAVALSTGLGSCADWLDVPPHASVSEQVLFETEEGFQEATIGLYTSAAEYSLYGGVFTIEMPDAMMQNYSFGMNDPTDYSETASFDFAYGLTRSRFSMVWDKAYTTVANSNLILKNIEEGRDKDLFHEGISEIIEAEALAMRAYLHFDMLRLCVPAREEPANNAAYPAIPYVTEYTNKVTAISTGEQVIAEVLKDLNRAKELLAEHDPILSPEYVTGYNSSDDAKQNGGRTYEQNVTIDGEPLVRFLQNRRHRMNYYAVCGTLARAYLWQATAHGKTESFALAAQNAQEVIDVCGVDNASKFYWTTATDFTGPETTKTRDRIGYNELLMAFYMDNERQINELNNRFSNVESGYYVNADWLSDAYEMGTSVGAEDMRHRAWFRTEPDGVRVRIIKYLRNSEDIGNRHYFVAPAIRMSEMYYIHAECRNSGSVEGDKWEPLNTVRGARGIRTLLSDADDFTAELMKEYRKETYCEAQAFFSQKRLRQTIYGPMGRIYTAEDGIYFPTISGSSYEWLPESETLYREK